MENSSKALLIAAAILIVILLITVSIKILSSPKDVTQQAESVGQTISKLAQGATGQIQSSYGAQGTLGSGSTAEGSAGTSSETGDISKSEGTIDGGEIGGVTGEDSSSIVEENKPVINIETSKETGPLLDAINTENYGKKVIGYKSKGEGLDTLVWRIFYEDEKNVYLISETADGGYPVLYETSRLSDMILEKYSSGSAVSSQGQNLMPLAGKYAFTDKNEGINIKYTAYMCDINVWDPYTDKEGRAVWAMGGPTIELFAKSYNNYIGSNCISVTPGGNGVMEGVGYKYVIGYGVRADIR